MTSCTASESSGTLYSNSMSAGKVSWFFFMYWSTSATGVSPWPKGRLGPLSRLPVFEVEAQDSVAVFFDQREGRLVRAGDVVADVQVDAEVLAVRENLAVVGGGRELRVVVEPDHDLVLVGDAARDAGRLSSESSRVMPLAPRALAAAK